MNITKDYLRKIIKEELANISIPDKHTVAIDILDKLILKNYKNDEIMNDLVQDLRDIVTDYESSVEYSPDGDIYGSGRQEVDFAQVEKQFNDLRNHINNKGYKKLRVALDNAEKATKEYANDPDKKATRQKLVKSKRI
jgi:hypothetical protein